MEIWKDILGYEGIYQASNEGRIRLLISRKNIKPGIMKDQPLTDKRGYSARRIRLTNNKIRKTYNISRLVASAFLGFDLNTKMKDGVIMHLDNNPSNNRLENLKIGTQSENTKQCISEGRGKQFGIKGEQHGCSKLTEEQVLEIRKLNAEGVPYGTLIKMFPISKTNIGDIVRRNIWKHI